MHAETSTGALSDAQAISAVAGQFDALSIVDAVTSLGGVPLLVDEWQLDAVSILRSWTVSSDFLSTCG